MRPGTGESHLTFLGEFNLRESSKSVLSLSSESESDSVEESPLEQKPLKYEGGRKENKEEQLCQWMSMDVNECQVSHHEKAN